ncbi:MAG: tRNA dihydrouridine synthase DusB [Deltaproteobacteria bacterium]|nr:tRNA dihydrouridine synthase DusB [Deltaproteobacteria bacterium]
MKIGPIKLDNITVLAPLAGITNLPLRIIAKESGCGLVCSEMISANGLIHKSVKTEKLLDSHPDEKPLSVQIFGSDPSIMAEAARIIEASGASILDINFGCSVRKVVRTGAGVALMRDPERAEAVITAVRKAVSIPFTIKIRTGWDKSGVQNCGVDALAIHPRTACQGFKGEADWELISTLKKSVSIPVIGNGDIVDPEDAIQMIKQTGCDAVMIGRAAIGNPWIFSQVSALMQGEEIQPIDLSRRFDSMIKYLEASVKYLGEKSACYMMRSRLGWFIKGLRSSSRFRESIKQVSSEDQAKKIIAAYRDSLEMMGDRR